MYHVYSSVNGIRSGIGLVPHSGAGGSDCASASLRSHKYCRPFGRQFCLFVLWVRKLFVFVLAFLVCNTTAGLAGGLAGSLAFAAAAVFGALTERSSL